jgi:sucrose phosphorylase
MRNGVQLIAYADRLAGTIGGVADLLDGPLRGVFEGIHLLPFYTPFDGSDAGYDPRDHGAVDPRLGTWDDVARLAGVADICADLIVNHVSIDSPWVRDVLAHGEASPSAEMVLTYDDVFPGGATETDLTQIYRPRPGLPFRIMRLGERTRLLWTTFGDEQVDLNLNAAGTWEYLTGVLARLAKHGVRRVRLDAVGYIAKSAGTSCFLTDDTLDLVRRLAAEVDRLGLTSIAELHAHHEQQERLAGLVDHVYDFALPPLVLHAVHSGDVVPLARWLDRRPQNAVTVLDTHDGIGVMDVGPDPTRPGTEGLLSPAQIQALVQTVHRVSNGTSRRATGGAASNLDLYQVNCTWYDAVGRDDARMCLSRLIQLFLPGLPQVYYVGLLAGGNDLAELERTGVGRDVNRHRYSREEVATALRQPVPRAQLAMIRLRNGHPAFEGAFIWSPGPQPGQLSLQWVNGPHHASLHTVPGQGQFEVTWSTADGVSRARTVAELADLARADESGTAP